MHAPTWSAILLWLVDGSCAIFLFNWGFYKGKKSVPTTVNITVQGDHPAVNELRTIVSQSVGRNADKPK